jgi:hypothetical protein
MAPSRWLAAGVLLLTLGTGAPSCRGSEPQDPADSPVTATLHLESGAGEELGAFRRGEPVILRLVVTNRYQEVLRLRCSSARIHDARVTGADGRELWRWSQGQRYAQVLSEVTLSPGETREFRVRWDQTTSAGGAAPPGRYQAEAWIPALGAAVRSAPISFELR